MSPLHLQIICFVLAIYTRINRHYFQTWFYDIYWNEPCYLNSAEYLHYTSSNENEKSFALSNILMHFVVRKNANIITFLIYLFLTLRSYTIINLQLSYIYLFVYITKDYPILYYSSMHIQVSALFVGVRSNLGTFKPLQRISNFLLGQFDFYVVQYWNLKRVKREC